MSDEYIAGYVDVSLRLEEVLREYRRLEEQLRCAVLSLSVFDEGCCSEYWERYPGNPKHE